MPSNRLDSAVGRRMAAWAGQIAKIAKEFAPQHIKPYIKGAVTKSGRKYAIVLSVDLNANPVQKYGSRDAAAQEYGSGIRAQVWSGNSGRNYIPIVPKEKPYLVFNWDKAITPKNPKGIVRTLKVKSPGIYPYKGAGYMGIAIQEWRASAKGEMSVEVKNAVTNDLRVAFKNAKQVR